MDIYIHGHGSYHPRYGYATVPAGFSVTFYTHFAKTMSGSTVYPFLSGKLIPEVERVVGEHMSVPNMHYAVLPAVDKQAASQANTKKYQLFMPNADMFLSQIFAGFTAQMQTGMQKANAAQLVSKPDAPKASVNLHWLCCQTLLLEKVGGRKLGVNAQDMRHNPGHLDQYRFNWNDASGIAREEFVNIKGQHT